MRPPSNLSLDIEHRRFGETTSLLHSRAEGRKLRPHVEGTARSATMVINIVTCGLGAGVFSLPWSTAGASVVTGVLIVSGVLLLNIFTITILVEAAERHQAFDVGSLVSRLPGGMGRTTQFAVNGAVWLSSFVCLVSYVILIVDCFLPFFGNSAEAQQAFLHWRPAMVGLTPLVLLPLCLLHEDNLVFCSTTCILGTVLVMIVLIISFTESRLRGQSPPACIVGVSWGSVAMVSATMQSVAMNMIVLPIYGDMKDRSPSRFRPLLLISFSILFFICIFYSFFGYLAFGETVRSNVLLSLPSNGLGNLARAAAAASVLGVYPMVLRPMVAPFREANGGRTVQATTFDTQTIRATFGIVLMVSFTATNISELGLINVINGAAATGFFVSLIPCIVGLHLLGPDSHTVAWRASMFLLLTFGTVMCALGLVEVDNHVEALREVCTIEADTVLGFQASAAR